MRRDALPSITLELEPHASAAHDWRTAGLVLGLCLVWTLAWYGSTGKAMVDIWRRSDTFAHGFIVVPVVFWLVWRMRDELAVMVPRPGWWALPPLAATGFAWLLGELASINALTQFALTALLVLTVMAVVGAAVARRLAFPLAFMFFAVPIGEFMMPQLIQWTADFTVLALRLSGVPVYREGQLLVLPSGNWSVVEACSGIRYLIASLMIGTLFAYTTYRSLKRRLIFVAIAAIVPIVANWLRAYIIVMLGHVSNNKIAAGVDHLIYGWLFFGVVIAILLWIGARWREDDLEVDPPPAGTRVPSPLPQPTAGRFWFAAVAVALVIGAWKVGYWMIERSDVAAPPELARVASLDPWDISAEPRNDWRPYFENPSAELQQSFRNGENKVGLFLGYYRNQNYDRKLVSSTNVLVRSSDSTWIRTAGGTRNVLVNGRPLQVRTARLRRADGERMVVWQWYWIGGRLTASDHWAKGYTALSRLQGRGDDSAVVILYAPEEQANGGTRALEGFVQAAAPAIEKALRQARDTR